MIEEKQNEKLVRYYETKLRKEFYKPAMDSLFEETETEDGTIPDNKLAFMDGVAYGLENVLEGTAGILAQLHLTRQENEKLKTELDIIGAMANQIFLTGQLLAQLRDDESENEND